MSADLSTIRSEYRQGRLDKKNVDPDPIKQFNYWMSQALESEVREPTAMTLATADANGKPSARIVLLKGVGNDGFIFFTNYKSNKAKDLEANPQAALVLYWQELERQVRIEGRISKASDIESDKYFSSRPPESQVSAIISPQSEVIPDRQFLINLRDKHLKSEQVKQNRPDYWGGYRLAPDRIEFWQGRPNRLHDRISYSREGSEWKIYSLAP